MPGKTKHIDLTQRQIHQDLQAMPERNEVSFCLRLSGGSLTSVSLAG